MIGPSPQPEVNPIFRGHTQENRGGEAETEWQTQEKARKANMKPSECGVSRRQRARQPNAYEGEDRPGLRDVMKFRFLEAIGDLSESQFRE